MLDRAGRYLITHVILSERENLAAVRLFVPGVKQVHEIFCLDSSLEGLCL